MNTPAASLTGISRASKEAGCARKGYEMTTEPQVGEWIILRDWSLSVRQVDKITPKLLKLGAGTQRYPSQVFRGDRKIIAVAPDRQIAERIRDGIGGIDGEYNRRRAAADEERSKRVQAADVARQEAIAKLVAREVSA